jgi:hypothetical protein
MTTIIDPIHRTAELICSDNSQPLETRLKNDIFSSISRIKPDITENVDFDRDVMSGAFFSTLSPPLQGIAIARCEGTLAFYNRVGWHPDFLSDSLDAVIPQESIDTFKTTYHATSMHDLAYVHPKHFEKILGKAGAASMWENIKLYTASKSP